MRWKGAEATLRLADKWGASGRGGRDGAGAWYNLVKGEDQVRQRRRSMAMATGSLEERVTAIEAELAQLKKQLAAEKPQGDLPWYEKIFGTFADSEEYEEAMRLGREYRESLRPEGEGRGDG
jgi:hypothetical protein